MPLANDFTSETPETFSIALSDPVGALLAATAATATIYTFAPGETEKTVDVFVIGDAEHERDETFALAAGSSAFGEVRIVDDDEPPVRRRATRP